MKIRFNRAALRDYDEAIEWYRSQDAQAALDLDDTFAHAFARIEDFPEIGPPYPRRTGTRALVVPEFPYVIVYEIGDREITILAVAHTSRRPGYWSRRK